MMFQEIVRLSGDSDHIAKYAAEVDKAIDNLQ